MVVAAAEAMWFFSIAHSAPYSIFIIIPSMDAMLNNINKADALKLVPFRCFIQQITFPALPISYPWMSLIYWMYASLNHK